MKQKFVVSAAAVAFALLLSALLARAAEQPAQPYPPGTLLTVAGNGTAGFSGDGGPATQAAFDNPFDVLPDTAGNLFIADSYNHRVRMVSPTGTITTVAGSGPAGGNKGGFSGDGGPAVKARLNLPTGVTWDRAGNLLISDCLNGRIWQVDAAGIITTAVRGLNCPQKIALDREGNLIFPDFLGQRIWKVDRAGVKTSVAGGGKPADGRGDGGPATAARLKAGFAVAVDREGNLFIADFVDNRVRKVSLNGQISTVAGGGQPQDGVGDGGPATEARLDGAQSLAVDPGGNLFITENRGERIRKVDPAGMITTVAGTGQIGYTPDGGLATAARLNSPDGVAVDRAGNLYFTEGWRYAPAGEPGESPGNNLVRKVIGVAVPG
jgi:sugar lactone lactonase YvrE